MAVRFFRVRRGCSYQTQEEGKEWMSDKIHHSLSQCNTAWKEPHKHALHVSRMCDSYIFYIHEFELLWWFQAMSLKSGWQYNSHRETEQFRTVPAIMTYSLYSNMKIKKVFLHKKMSSQCKQRGGIEMQRWHFKKCRQVFFLSWGDARKGFSSYV